MMIPMPLLHKTLVVSLLPLAWLSGCASLNDATMGLLSSTAPALAVVDGRVLGGEVRLYTDRTGVVSLSATEAPVLDCMGSLRYTASSHGVMNLRCSNGHEAMLSFNALSETSGHARGPGPRDAASLTWGLAPGPASAWLVPPAGKRLVVSDDTLRLE